MTTIAYQGTAASMDHVHAILAKVQQFTLAHGWKVESSGSDHIVVMPHPRCESIAICFNSKLRFSDVTKTIYAPVETHHEIAEFFFEIKPLLKRLRVDDDTGYWYSFLEERLKKKSRELLVFPEVRQEEIISGQLALPAYATSAEREFWTLDVDNRDPYYGNKKLLHYATIRNKIGNDLTNGSGQALTTADLVAQQEAEGLFTYDSEFYQMYQWHYFQDMAALWAWRNSSNKPTEIKRNRCNTFAYALEKFTDGSPAEAYGDKLERDVFLALDKLLEKEGPASPYRSLQIFYALLDFCHLNRKDVH